ncbi:hypothetical protein ACQP60_04250 [Isoptericola variabilis]|uniref:hypothetical protein n=1 Tax=Isoptericola variabilis TaxID=139208 RepID=UPI003D23FA2B
MSKHQYKTAAQITCERVAARIAELVDPWTEVVEQRVPVRGEDGRWRLTVEVTHVDQAALLDQLANPEPGSTAGVGSSDPSARAAANLGGLAVLQDIDADARLWLSRIDGRWSHAGIVASLQGLGALAHKRPTEALRANIADISARLNATLEDRLRQIARAAGLLPEDTLWNLDREVMRWWANARIATTWADPPLKPHVPCPECGAHGKVQVRLNPKAAVCIACGTAWDSLTINELGTHVQLLVEHEAAERTARQIESRPCMTCGQEHAAGDFSDPDVYLAHTPAALVGRTTPDVVGSLRSDVRTSA